MKFSPMGLTVRELCPYTSTGDSPDNSWVALTVRTQHEQAVCSALLIKGFEAYAPMHTVSRRWSDREKKLHAPLFPGYVFCRRPSLSYTTVVRTPGVRSVVAFGGEVARVSDLAIENIRRALAARVDVQPCRYLATGARVRIEAGPLAGLEGFFVEERDSARIVINVEMLQRSVSVEVDVAAVSPVSPLASVSLK